MLSYQNLISLLIQDGAGNVVFETLNATHVKLCRKKDFLNKGFGVIVNVWITRVGHSADNPPLESDPTNNTFSQHEAVFGSFLL